MEELKDLHRKEHLINETSLVNIEELGLLSNTILGALMMKKRLEKHSLFQKIIHLMVNEHSKVEQASISLGIPLNFQTKL